ncbi:MAG: hypothetical protein OEZ39_13530 [Gammaproteobacteria bacterium]|nr:hypothetical protein [Gammaproteobacteria bacterium]MDH5652872.1 hypothetical protein [Gammaproteobacteria bacterium]
MSCQLTLSIPGLLSPPMGFNEIPAGEFPVLSSLTKLLSRADQSTNSQSGFYAELFAEFGIQLQGKSAPVAALSHFLNANEAGDDWYLCVDPVFIQADLTAAYLLAHEALNLQSDEATQLIATLNNHFAQDGWQISMAAEQRWYLTGSGKTSIRTTVMHEAMGRHMGHCLPVGDDASYWRSVMNEVQMLLHEHPVNQAREAAGQLPVNSVWLWGEGHLPKAAQHKWQSVYSNEFTSQALAQFSGIPCHDLPNDISSVMKHCTGNLLYVDDQLLTRQHGFDIYYWLTALHELEQQVFTPLLQALQAGHVDELTILSGDGRRFTIKRKQLKRWWRRSKPLAHWVKATSDAD